MMERLSMGRLGDWVADYHRNQRAAVLVAAAAAAPLVAALLQLAVWLDMKVELDEMSAQAFSARALYAFAAGATVLIGSARFGRAWVSRLRGDRVFTVLSYATPIALLVLAVLSGLGAVRAHGRPSVHARLAAVFARENVRLIGPLRPIRGCCEEAPACGQPVDVHVKSECTERECEHRIELGCAEPNPECRLMNLCFGGDVAAPSRDFLLVRAEWCHYPDECLGLWTFHRDGERWIRGVAPQAWILAQASPLTTCVYLGFGGALVAGVAWLLGRRSRRRGLVGVRVGTLDAEGVVSFAEDAPCFVERLEVRPGPVLVLGAGSSASSYRSSRTLAARDLIPGTHESARRDVAVGYYSVAFLVACLAAAPIVAALRIALLPW